MPSSYVASACISTRSWVRVRAQCVCVKIWIYMRACVCAWNAPATRWYSSVPSTYPSVSSSDRQWLGMLLLELQMLELQLLVVAILLELLLELLVPALVVALLLLKPLLLELLFPGVTVSCESISYRDVSQWKGRGDRSPMKSTHFIKSLTCGSGTYVCL